MAVLLTPPKLQFFDNSGAPLAFGKVYTYAATGGTFSTPKATYTTQAGNVANANPVVLDAAGRANIWIEGSYDFRVTDANDVQLYTQLAVTAFSALPAESDSYSETLSGNGSQVAFTLSEDLGTDENAILVWVDNTDREYVTNGSFATDTGWTKGSGWTIGSGVATATGAISTAIEQSAAFTIDQYRAYTVTFTITRSAGTLTPSIGGTNGTAQNASGTYTETIVAGSTQTIAFTGSGFTGTLDNVSVVVTNTSGFQIQPPANYTIDGTTLTLTSAPASGTNNIFVTAPSLLVGAASSAAADAAASAAAALASEQAAQLAETNAETAETNAETAETNAAASAAAALASQNAAATSEDNAELWANGGTGGTPSSTDNAKYWSEQAEGAVTGSILPMTEQALTPSTPSSGVSKLYFKTDSFLYRLDDAGNEEQIADNDVLATGTDYARTLNERFLDITNVLDFIPAAERAAIKNGTSTYDASADIQACIDFVDGAGGGFVQFPTGLYSIETSVHVPQGVYTFGEGSRQSEIFWGDSGTSGFEKGMIYVTEGTDMSPGFVFSCGISNLKINCNGVADVALAVRGVQENCIFGDLVLSEFLVAGLDILAFTSRNHAAVFRDLHIIPNDAATSAYGIRGEYINRCEFTNITTDSAAGTYARGISLQRAVNNIFDGITTEDCDYGLHISTSSGNNTYRQLEGYRATGTGTAHVYTDETRYTIQGIRTRTGFTNQLENGSNVVAAGTDTDTIMYWRGGSVFRRVADTETYTTTRPAFIRGDRQVKAGTSGNGQSTFRSNTTIAISGTKEVVVDVGAESRGFSGVLTLFSTGDQRYSTQVFFGGFVSTSGTVSGGEVSAQTGSNTTRVSIAAPAAVSGGATSQQFGIVITNASGSLAQVLEVKLEITVQSGQASTMTIV